MFQLTESKSLIEIIFPSVELADLQIFDASTQYHVKQLERMHSDWPEQDDSEVGQAIPMMLTAREGKFIADGQSIRRIK
jgi:hypothetical protein